jgi:hypothetical protein
MKEKHYRLLVMFGIILTNAGICIESPTVTIPSNVKTIERVYYNYSESFGEQMESLYQINKKTYNKNGDIIRSQTINSSGKQKDLIIYKYDEGRLAKKFFYEGDKPLDEYEKYYAYEYRLDGKLTLRKEYDNKRELEKVIRYNYNSRGSLIEETFYGSDGQSFSKNNYEYDSRNNLVQKIYRSDIINMNSTYKYDSNNKLVDHYATNKNGNIKRHYLYFYDGLGRLIKESSWNYEKLFIVLTNELLTSMYEYENGVVVVEDVVEAIEEFGEVKEVPHSRVSYEYIYY